MAVPAEIARHLDRHNDELHRTFSTWRSAAADPEAPTPVADLVAGYLRSAGLGDIARLESNSVATYRDRAGRSAPVVLVIGSHDVSQLVARGASPIVNPDFDGLSGPGVASMLGATVAFVEGFRSTITETTDEPLNLAVASIGADDTIAEVVDRLDIDTVDAIVMTHAVNWQPDAPTLTVGSRGRVEAEITLSASSAVNDLAFAGATRNPLNRLVEMIAAIRDDRGRISLADFYRRAERPDSSALAGLDGLAPEVFASGLGAAVPSGSLAPVQRATQWPVVSVLSVDSDSPGPHASPASAKARLALHLVPHQRPAEVERSLRAWVEAQTPSNMVGQTSIVSLARPYRAARTEPVVAAQARAIAKVYAKNPILVPAGGTLGAGELHYRTGAPVAFAGIAGPAQGWGTVDEFLARPRFNLAVATAAATCRQMKGRLPQRSSA